jgi:hypothetical protein
VSAAKARVSGAWVDTGASGLARLGGVSIPFGPEAGGPTLEAINWVAAPALTNVDDGPTAAYSMGCSFTVTTPKLCYGLRWRVPDSLITPAVGYFANLWQIAPDVQQKKQAIVPVAGGDQDFLWDAPVLLANTEQYTVGVTTVKYSFRAAASVGGFPFASPSGNVLANTGRLTDPANPDAPPSSSFASIYYVSPLVEV